MLLTFKWMLGVLLNQRGEVMTVENEGAAGADSKGAGADPQTETVTDFFAEQLVDDSGNPLNMEADKNEPNKGEKDDAGKDGKEPEGKTPEKKEGAETPEIVGIEKSFFENNVFDPSKALDFFIPETPGKLNFEYKAPQLTAKEAAAAGAPDNTPPWKKELEEEKTYRETLRTNLLSPLQNYIKARNELGMDEKEAFDYAQAQALEGFNTHIAERDWESRLKREEELNKKSESTGKLSTIRQNARSNELAAMQELGGEDNYRTLMFGYKDSKGKLVPGVGAPVLYKMFEITNPGVRKGDSDSYSKKLSEWWDGFVGDPEEGFSNLQFLLTVVKGELQRKHFPEIVKTIRKSKEKGDQSRAEGGMPKPSKAQVEARGGNDAEDSGLKRYFQGPDKVVETI